MIFVPFFLRQDEALLEEESAAQKSDEALSALLEDKRELLDAQECELEELNRLNHQLSTRKSKLALQVAQTEESKETLDKELIKSQQTGLHLNVDYNNCVDSLCEEVQKIQEKIENTRCKPQESDLIPTTVLGAFDKAAFLKEDADLSTKIEEYVRININQVEKDTGIIRLNANERTSDEQAKLVNEVERMNSCHQTEAKKYLLKSAELASAKAAQQEINLQTKKLIEGKISIEKSYLQEIILELESGVANLQGILTNLLKDKLPCHLEELTAEFRKSIFHADIDAKIAEQKGVLLKMNVALEFLLQQSSYQELFGLLVEYESSDVVNLGAKLTQILKLKQDERELDEKLSEDAEHIKEKSLRRSKNVLQHDDTFLIALHQILTNSDVDPNLITDGDMKNLVSGFIERKNNIDKLALKMETDWQKRKTAIERIIEKIQKELEIDSNGRCVLTPAEVINKIKLVENKMEEFQRVVQAKQEEWSKFKKEIKGHSLLAIQKKFSGTNILESFGSKAH